MSVLLIMLMITNNPKLFVWRNMFNPTLTFQSLNMTYMKYDLETLSRMQQIHVYQQLSCMIIPSNKKVR